jgi:hypothetical protein
MPTPRATVVLPAGSRPATETGLGSHEARVKALERNSDAAVTNHMVEASGALTIASDGGAPATPTPIGISIAIAHRTVGSEDLFFISSGTLDYLTIADQGTYTVKAFASFPEGLSGYIGVSAVIAGDAELWTVAAPRFVPASYAGGVGGGYVEWEDTITVLDTAVVGTATEVGVTAEVWQSSGSDQVAVVFVQVLRHT